MKTTRRLAGATARRAALVVAVAAVSALLVRVSPAQDVPQDAPEVVPAATLVVSSSTATSALGFSLVDGTLRQRDKTYMVRLRGAQPASDSLGQVYGLAQPRDIAGEYAPTGDGWASQRGVRIVFFPPLDVPSGRLVIELSSRVYPKASTGQRGTVD